MASTVQYMVDEKGERQAVVLSIDEYERMKEDLADLAVAAERRSEVSISHEQFMAELKHDGILSN